ncbi:hypothetical protein [Streptomyces sp. YU58]|uniref:hypothetical protein n=1 Tax=Streptomyces sp. SX92 TaxID=3158972 RepID=UPI0027B9663C|nr:hypothetical protein [Streptomyces coralus]WLW58799.1 hypothetical protein QU709_45470 [Streptomyces coralus]
MCSWTKDGCPAVGGLSSVERADDVPASLDHHAEDPHVRTVNPCRTAAFRRRWAAAVAGLLILPPLYGAVVVLIRHVGGRVIWSFAAPIAVVESCASRITDRRWVGPFGIGVMVLLWALSAALVHDDTAADSAAGPAQLIGTAVITVALIAAAFAVRPARTRSSGKTPSRWLVGGVTGTVWHAIQRSRRQGRGRRHVLAVAGSALVGRAGLSFLVEPLGDHVDLTVKYTVNAAMLAGVAALLLMAAHRLRRQELSAC